MFLTTVFLLGFAWGEPAVSRPLTSIAEVETAFHDPANLGRPFSVTGTVIQLDLGASDGPTLSLAENGVRVPFVDLNNLIAPTNAHPALELGDQLHLKGILFKEQAGIWAGFQTMKVLDHPGRDALPVITAQDLPQPKWKNRAVRLDGIVRDASLDESDPGYIHFTINQAGDPAPVMIRHPDMAPFDPHRFLGARIAAFGYCSDNLFGLRKHVGRLLFVSDMNHIQVITSPATAGSAPDLETLADASPKTIDAQGLHQVEGVVTAVWSGNQMLLQTKRMRVVHVSLQQPDPPPCGSSVRALGLPVTDYYNLNLLHGTWKSIGRDEPLPSPQEITLPTSLLCRMGNAFQLQVKNHGRVVKMSGIIRHIPLDNASPSRLLLEVDGQLVPVDASATPKALDTLSVGCRVSVTGTCVMNVDNWRLDSTAQQPTGYFLALRRPEDILILSRPSWWTPGRLMALLGLLAAALLGVIGWNVSLNRRADRKGKELAAEQLAHVTSKLKVNERTRLAVELHDALSQTLTGVSMQIDTAAGIVKEREPAAKRCLDIASRTIDACRMELRNTLWDLRSAALDEPDMDTAIRKTLCQNLAGIDLSVRFNVPRETFSDNTAHAILKIIRELATNTLRHGKATSLKIAGSVEGDKLLFSVKDNGCGFDPDLAPGIAQGHFGLQGVAERLERLNGEMTIDSTPGKGTKVTVILPVPHSGE